MGLKPPFTVIDLKVRDGPFLLTGGFSGYLTGTVYDIAMAVLDYVLNSLHTAHPSKHSLKLVASDCLCSQGLSRVIQKDGLSS